PILLARRGRIAERLRALDLAESKVTVLDVETADRQEAYAQHLHEKRRRDGVTLDEARKLMRQRNYFGTMMVEEGDADGLISGLTQSYPETIRPALQIIDLRPGVKRICGAYLLILKNRDRKSV